MHGNVVMVMVITRLLSRVAVGFSFGVVKCPRKLERSSLVGGTYRSATSALSASVASLQAPAIVSDTVNVQGETSTTSVNCDDLQNLVLRVVQGTAEKAIPAGSHLRRRRSWDLFWGPADGCAEIAILVVNKKSSFTVEDARLAVAIMQDENAARCTIAQSDSNPVTGENQVNIRQLLLATRSDVTPAADAFISGLRRKASVNGADGTAAILRWEQLTNLVQDGSLGSYLTRISQATGGGISSGVTKTGAFSLPQWLVEEREGGRRERSERLFDLEAPFEPSGDQPEAIEALCRGLAEDKRFQTLLGATGTGKTFIVANVIQKAARPTLVLAPNKVLAAQLTSELRALFPRNAVEYFVSYYDYFMPEAFNSASDTYIDKVVLINDDIDRMRHSATRSLLERRDVIVVASVSCIYGLGIPSKYLEASIRLVVGQEWGGGWRTLAQHLEQNLYYEPQHNGADLAEFEVTPRGKFRFVPHGGGGGIIEIGPAADETVVSVYMDGQGVVTRMHVTPTGTSGHETAERKKSLRGLSAVLAAGGIDIDGAVDEGPHDTMPPVHSAEVVQEGRGGDVDAHVIYPAKHHVVTGGEMETVLEAICGEMEDRCSELGRNGMLLEAERLRQRTENDMMLLRAVGTCKGVENYSRHLAGRSTGDPPETLIDYFPEDDWLLIVDESHVSAPQLGAMHGGNLARKVKLVEHGFRLPSALDNRPLKATEFWSKVNKTIFLSATPSKLELELSNPSKLEESVAPVEGPSGELTTRKSGGRGGGGAGGLGWDEIGTLVDAQAVIRPTGITDPPVDIRPSEGQVADLVQECRTRGERGERVLVTTLTKRMAEDLCAFLVEQGVPTAYLHSDVKPMQRLELLRQLRSGEVDVIVGVNLLREGLNLPEVSLVCILDADAEGFLRSDTALLQTIGRATRHQAGRAVLYADRVTPSMKRALAETDRRRDIQMKHNELHGITPRVAMAASVGNSLLDSIGAGREADGSHPKSGGRRKGDDLDDVSFWADPALPPDQVQLLYDLAAQNRGGPSRSRVGPILSSARTVSCAAEEKGAIPALKPSEDTSRALKRLSEQASEKMLLAAGKTDFTEAALWRDRRDALLATMRRIEDDMELDSDEETGVLMATE